MAKKHTAAGMYGRLIVHFSEHQDEWVRAVAIQLRADGLLRETYDAVEMARKMCAEALARPTGVFHLDQVHGIGTDEPQASVRFVADGVHLKLLGGIDGDTVYISPNGNGDYRTLGTEVERILAAMPQTV